MDDCGPINVNWSNDAANATDDSHHLRCDVVLFAVGLSGLQADCFTADAMTRNTPIGESTRQATRTPETPQVIATSQPLQSGTVHFEVHVKIAPLRVNIVNESGGGDPQGSSRFRETSVRKQNHTKSGKPIWLAGRHHPPPPEPATQADESQRDGDLTASSSH